MADITDIRHKPERYRHLFYEGEPAVFINKLGIRDQAELNTHEKDALRVAYLRLDTGVFKPPDILTTQYLLDLHRAVFGHLYEWAGKLRSVDLAPWAPPQFVQQTLDSLDRTILARPFLAQIRTDRDFCQAAAQLHGEFVAVHPFLDGNGRTVRLAIDALAHRTGRPILQYDRSEQGKARYLAASSRAFHDLNYEPLAAVLAGALDRGRPLAPGAGPHASSPNLEEERLDAALKELPASQPKLEIKR